MLSDWYYIERPQRFYSRKNWRSKEIADFIDGPTWLDSLLDILKNTP